MTPFIRTTICFIFGALLIAGCNDMDKDHDNNNGGAKSMLQMAGKVAVCQIKPSKAATTQPTNNNVMGTVTFTEMGDKVHVTAHITGLAPNSEHGFHIHEKGDLSDAGLMSTGGHFNPSSHPHGARGMASHAGDLGNIKADATGMAMVDVMAEGISIGTGNANDIVGHAVIVHASPDDLKSQPSGNAGARIAGGVIEMQK